MISTPENIAFELYCKEKAFRKSQHWNSIMDVHLSLQKCFGEFRKQEKIPLLKIGPIYSPTVTFESSHHGMLQGVLRFCYYERLRRGSDLALSRVTYRYFEAVIKNQWKMIICRWIRDALKDFDPAVYDSPEAAIDAEIDRKRRETKWKPNTRSLLPGKKNKALFFHFISDPKNIRVKREDYWRPMLPHRFESQKERWVKKWAAANPDRWREIQNVSSTSC